MNTHGEHGVTHTVIMEEAIPLNFIKSLISPQAC
jgi:hypothetical protein